MICMLLIGEIKPKTLTLQDEEKEFNPMIKGNLKEIFGEEHENNSENDMLLLWSSEWGSSKQGFH